MCLTPPPHACALPLSHAISKRLEGNVKKFEQQGEQVKGNIAALQKQAQQQQ